MQNFTQNIVTSENRLAVKVFALVKHENGLPLRPADIEPSIAAGIFTSFESALTSSSVVSVKGETLTAIDMTATKVVRKTEAFLCPLAVPVAYTDMEDFNGALDTAFAAAFPGKAHKRLVLL